MKMNDYRPFGSFPENCTNCLPLEQEISVAAASAFQLGKSYDADATCTAETITAPNMKCPDSIESDFHKSITGGVQCFSTLADQLVPQTPWGAERCKTFYLDRSLLQISNQVIGCSRTSEIFRGVLDGKPVAVKQLRVELVENIDRKELKDLIREICLMCR